MTEEAESTKSDQGSSGWTHIAAYAALWGFGFLILRIFAVSGYRWNTAFAVSTTVGLDDGLALVFGSLMAGHLLTAFLLMGVLPLLIVASLWGQSSYRPFLLLLTALGLVILIALTVSFHSWWLPPATALILGSLVLTHRLPKRHRLRNLMRVAIARVGGLTGLATLVVAALVQTPWVPREQIGTADGTITGYVLSVDAGYLNVLTDQHEFVILISNDVRFRR